MAVTHCCHQGVPCDATTSPLERTPQIHRAGIPGGWVHSEGLGPEGFCSLVLFGPQLTPSNGVPECHLTPPLSGRSLQERGHLPLQVLGPQAFPPRTMYQIF